MDKVTHEQMERLISAVKQLNMTVTVAFFIALGIWWNKGLL
jgi:hypothetical protein